MAIPKGFISLGKNITLNVSAVDTKKTYYDKKKDVVVIIDKYGCKFNVDKKLLKGRLEVKNNGK